MVESETLRLTDENRQLKRALVGEYRPENMVGQSGAMRAVFDQIMMVAGSRATVLITGESGTGKELVAKAIHAVSDRREKPFIGISCAGIPETMMENELFGHERGAFTGAVALQKGRFELANGGTIFLDEVGDIPLSIQVKLLRVLQEREIERLGGKETIKLDVRLVAATNRDLAVEMRAGTFREDLYYRLNVIPIHLPPLRERVNDVPLLADHFLKKFSAENNRKIKGFSREAMAALMRYPWPGNVRELENLIQRMVILDSDSVIGMDDLPPPSSQGKRVPMSSAKPEPPYWKKPSTRRLAFSTSHPPPKESETRS
jgi:transcriptional regulator with GAF, ATPase, and Fis domain